MGDDEGKDEAVEQNGAGSAVHQEAVGESKDQEEIDRRRFLKGGLGVGTLAALSLAGAGLAGSTLLSKSAEAAPSTSVLTMPTQSTQSNNFIQPGDANTIPLKLKRYSSIATPDLFRVNAEEDSRFFWVDYTGTTTVGKYGPASSLFPKVNSRYLQLLASYWTGTASQDIVANFLHEILDNTKTAGSGLSQLVTSVGASRLINLVDSGDIQLLSPTSNTTRPWGTLKGANLPQVYNVMGYGAKGNGVTDDGPAINATINAANAAGGGVVYLPKGTYDINTDVNLLSNVHLVGVGPLSILKADPAKGVNSLMVRADGNQSNFSLRDLMIDDNGIGVWGFRVRDGGNKWSVRKCRFKMTTARAAIGVDVGTATSALGDAYDFAISDNEFFYNPGAYPSIQIGPPVSTVPFTVRNFGVHRNVVIGTPPLPYAWSNSCRFHTDANNVVRDAIISEGSLPIDLAGNIKRVNIIGNVITSNIDNITLERWGLAPDAAPSDCLIADNICVSYPTAASGESFPFDINGTSRCTFRDNKIVVAGTAGSIVTGFLMIDNGSLAGPDNVFDGNEISDFTDTHMLYVSRILDGIRYIRDGGRFTRPPTPWGEAYFPLAATNVGAGSAAFSTSLQENRLYYNISTGTTLNSIGSRSTAFSGTTNFIALSKRPRMVGRLQLGGSGGSGPTLQVRAIVGFADGPLAPGPSPPAGSLPNNFVGLKYDAAAGLPDWRLTAVSGGVETGSSLDVGQTGSTNIVSFSIEALATAVLAQMNSGSGVGAIGFAARLASQIPTVVLRPMVSIFNKEAFDKQISKFLFECSHE